MTMGILAMAPLAFTVGGDPKKRSRWDLLFGSPDMRKAPHTPDPRTWSDDTITAAWLGHATVLINFFGTTILTDPVFSERVGIEVLGMTIGPKRRVEPALRIGDLPRIDLVLLSHGHMDHLDIPSLQHFPPDIPVIMAKNTADIIDDLAFRDVRELDWGERAEAAGVHVEAFQVRHFGWRFPWETDRSKTGTREGRSFNAYLITKNGRSILFGGDTAYQEHFREITRRGIVPELAIMPIGAYDPWIRNHCNPEQAVLMADHAGASTIMPIHFDTFIQSDEPDGEAIARLKAALSATPGRLALEEIGQTWQLAKGRAGGKTDL